MDDEAKRVLSGALERAVEQVAAAQPAVGAAVGAIVARNLERGRVAKFLQGDATAADYVALVTHYYQKCRPLVQQLQVEKDEGAWGDFYNMLQRWSYSYLRKREFPSVAPTHEVRQEHAMSCAARAAVAILRTPFPYDTDFSRWAYVVTQNICLRHMEAHWNPRHVTPTEAVALDQWEDWLQNLAVDDEQDPLGKAELRLALLQAIERLPSPEWRQILLLRYFEGKRYDECAAIMEKSKGNLYTLHFRALEALRAIWQDRGTKS